ncbi:precorrin 3B synthase CobZ [Rhodovulum sp. ES.010]|uniref:FAD-dependent tricarballylate dehydrogenase TcuA n=1 Tax=Rhodovulum sp. ES.010 TaxID=1882821 RepID=UPI000927F7C3|nr:FAD-dependent tricarballylate dehydrogenase TcuA [Rhodovulum sp. ES.010]SIO32371.1 precorrin 3B synthase CobZ [Rhodovulum sp. ES.010]
MRPPQGPADPRRTPLRTGVLVVGAGFAGLCAAIEARLSGASVTLIDAAPVHLRGGNARHSRNIRLAHDSESPWQREHYPVADFLDDLARIGAPDPALSAMLAKNSTDLGRWLAAQGVVFEPWADGNLPWSRRTAFFRGGGQALVNALYRRAEGLGVDIRYGWRVGPLDPESLLHGDGAPVRIDVEIPEGATTIMAAAVVLTCGGYGADRDRLAAHLGRGAHGFANRGTPFQRGEPLLWLLDNGAARAGRPGDGHLVAVDARTPTDDAGIVSRADGMHLGIVVDASGRRFHDEGAVTGPARYSHWGHVLAGQDDPRAWLVLGADGVAALPPMIYPPITADSPEALARVCKIDPAGLAATLSEFERHRAGGPLPAIPRSLSGGAPLLLSAPFAALPLCPGLGFTRHGVAVDAEARVRLAAGGVAPRLFAAGATMFGAVLGEGYLSGTALTVGGVFGRIAGRQAADLAGTAPSRISVAAGSWKGLPDGPAAAPAIDPVEEARRTLNICNTCGFCTGLCDVFPAARLRAALTDGDLRHLAHLCHDCRSCHDDCQYAPPHDFAVNLPAALAEMRAEEYRASVLPRGSATAWLAVVYALCLVGLPVAALLLVPPQALFSAHAGPGSFYAVIPHGVMAGGAGLAFGGAALILAVRTWLFWRAGRGPDTRHSPRTLARAISDVLTLRNLGGGKGPGCETREGPVGPTRRWAHHLMAYGFGLSFLATIAGAAKHHFFEQVAPYPVFSLPVALGALGGVAMLAGLAGLEARRLQVDRRPAARRMESADRFTRASLAIVAASGLALLAFRETAAMGLLLALHLGSVLGLALTLPFGKLSHGAYRALALLRHAGERAARAATRD